MADSASPPEDGSASEADIVAEAFIDTPETGIASEADIDLEDGVASGAGIAAEAGIAAASSIGSSLRMFATSISDIIGGLDTIWERVVKGKPTSEDVVDLLMVGGIPGVCGPGETVEEREMIMTHNRPRAEVASRILATPVSVHRRRRSKQRPMTTVASSEEELLFVFGGAFVPSTISSSTRAAACFLMYFFTYAALAGWMYFAIPLTASRPALWISARDWLDAPDWVWWVSFCWIGLPAYIVTALLIKFRKAAAKYKPALFFSGMTLLSLGLNVVSVCLLKWTDQGVNKWDSDSTRARVGTFFLVFACLYYAFIPPYISILIFESSRDIFDVADENKSLNISNENWQSIRSCVASVLRVEDAMGRFEDRAGLVQMFECLFRLVDDKEVKNDVDRGTHVQNQYSAMVWLCLDALAHLPRDRRNPDFGLSTVCSFGVTIYDCFSSICRWYVTEPALAPIVASTTGRTGRSVPRFFADKIRPGAGKDRAYVEEGDVKVVGLSFDTRGERSAGRPYSSSCRVVRVTIPPRQQPFVSKPEHSGLLGLVNTAAAVWFLVNWEADVYHVFLAAAVCGEIWAQLWVGIWWCSGDAPLVAFVDPVHWLLSRQEHVPDGAVRLLAGEASAAVLGAVAALTVIDNYVAGGVLGAVALVIAAALKIWVKGEDVAVVCFVAYLSELIIEVIIVVTSWNFASVNVALGVTAALESMVLTIRLLQVLVGRSLIGRELPVETRLDKVRESYFARCVACGYWGAVLTGHRPMFIMESVCSGSKTLSPSIVAKAQRVGYEETFHADSMRTLGEPGWGYVVSATGSGTSTAWGLSAEKGFTVFEVGSWYGKRYPCL